MGRILAVTVAAIALIGATLATAGQARAEDEGAVYQRYADIRERLYSCNLEEAWDTQTDGAKAGCRRVRRYYVLYGWPGEGFVLHVHCRSPRHCIATPLNEPPADGPIPAGATVYDVKVGSEPVRPTKKRRLRKKARSRRSRAARARAAAAH